MKILVYDDNPDYGGHQIMARHGVAALTADPSIELVCALNPANRQLAEKCADLNIINAPCSIQQIKSLKPDLMLCIQGDIAQSSRGVALAKKKTGIECVSYIALPHRLADMGAKLGALRDRMHQRFINAPDRYIALSKSMQQILIERGCTQPIAIVPNGIPAPPPTSTLKPHSAPLTTLGLLGRIEFSQKQQDFMVRTFLGHPQTFGSCQLLIAGDGPDREPLQKLIAGKENITLMPWQPHPDRFYKQIDALIIPSRYEGVPLVMLEALARGIPVLGSACDGMQDLLPEAWTFDPENAAALTYTFQTVQKSWQNEIDALQQKVLTKHALVTFKENFKAAVLGSSAQR